VLFTSLLPIREEDCMKPAGQMTLTLTPELENFVREEAQRGAFASSSEYVRDMLPATARRRIGWKS
jgi:Arc/MetJ-type ribon-helix-helix transcriptional regulator